MCNAVEADAGYYIVVWEREIVDRKPPFPFVMWTDDAVRRYLANQGFDLSKPIEHISDGLGKRWRQHL